VIAPSSFVSINNFRAAYSSVSIENFPMVVFLRKPRALLRRKPASLVSAWGKRWSEEAGHKEQGDFKGV
jgi:hypothetical protein